jgi:nucleotide-binding universal stress UspA family protein
MGTHGLRGMQFIVGSHALRVISECPVPVVIVQEKTNISNRLEYLIVPLDLKSETKQTLKVAADIAERFKAHVHLISPKETDEFLLNKILRNVGYAEGYLETRNVPYTSLTTKSGPSGFAKEMIQYAKDKSVDMICILNKADENLIHAFGIDSEQKMITNEPGIPVLIMNPAAASVDDRSIFAQ